jgi:hypothetical protein
MMVKVGDSGVQTQELLSAFPPFESLLRSLLSSCGSVFLFDDVAPGRGDHLLVVDVNQARDLPDGCPVAAELIGMDDLWDIVFSQQSGQEVFRCFGVPMPLEKNVEHETVLVHGPPKPVSDAVHARTHLVEMPPGTPTGFPVAQVFGEERAKLDAPLAERLMAYLNAALMQQFLHVPVTQGKAVVEPNGVLDDGHGEAVAVRFGVGHGGSAYPDPVKATQPVEALYFHPNMALMAVSAARLSQVRDS